MSSPRSESQIHNAFADFIEKWALDLAPRAELINAPAYGAVEDFNPLEQFKKDQANATGPTSRKH